MNDYVDKITRNLNDPETEARVRHGTELYRKGTAEITLTDKDGKKISNAELSFKQTGHEYNFGCNIFMLNGFKETEKNAAYEQTFSELFNMAVIPFYWSDLEPEDGKPRFDRDSPYIHRRPPPDLCLDFCERNGIRPKSHPLLWYSFLPDWLERKDARSRIERRFREIAERYANRISNWEVINEIMTRDSTGHGNVTEEQLPFDAVDFAFDLARKYFPESAILYLNDYFWQNYDAKSTPLYLRVKELVDRGKKVDCLGLQFHMMSTNAGDMLKDCPQRILNAENHYNCLDLYAKLGIPCQMSETTVNSPASLGDIREEFQAVVAEQLYRIWFSHPNTNGIIYWNLADNTAHVYKEGLGPDENLFLGGIVNNDMVLSRKKAYDALHHLIKKEWHSEGTVEYNSEKRNFFRGFYGDYDVAVRTNNGVFSKKISIIKGKPNKIRLKLD